MASSVSGKDESNPALWLAIRAGKMELSCPFGTTRCVSQEKFPRERCSKSFIDQACSVKMTGYWPRSFFAFMDLVSVSVHKHAKKEFGQHPAILTSHLVNNPCIPSLSSFNLQRIMKFCDCFVCCCRYSAVLCIRANDKSGNQLENRVCKLNFIP